MGAKGSTPHRRAATIIPAFDLSAPYTSRLSARSALCTELHLLLDAASALLPSTGYRKLVIDDNALSRPTRSARDKLWRELSARYRLEASDSLFAAFWREWQRSHSDAERNLTAYTLLALNDRVVFDLGVEWLFPLLRRAPMEIRASDIAAFLQRARIQHPEVAAWSEQTRAAVVSKYAASIRDFGIATGTISKTTVRPALYGSPIRLLLTALQLSGIRPMEQVRSSAFRLLGIEGNEVIDALSELNRLGALRFRMQADVIELDFVEGR